MAEEPATTVVQTPAIGGDRIPRWMVITLIVLVLVMGCFFLYAIWAFWPTDQAGRTPASGLAEEQHVTFLGGHLSISLDVNLFVIVAGTGALGGLIHTIRSLSWYLGNRSLVWSWVPFYLLLPIIGASGGTVFYLVFRAGLFSPSTTTTQVNPFGFTAVAALVGLFSEQAMEKLREVFGSLLAPAPAGKDHIEPRDIESSP